MQNQLTPGQTSLQQPAGNLQPNNSSLQQSGTPTTSPDVSAVLSQDAQTGGLRVQSTQTDPNAPSQTYFPSSSANVWIVPLAFVLAIMLAAIIWSRFRQEEPPVAQEEIPIAAEPPKQAAVSKKAKTGKKTSRRKRQAKR
jgi:hypothetical protein